MMRDVEEMTGPEVAAALGLTVEAVKSRLSRG
jgi:DNA-directed RNA polymerase specialized sigma24 family protein